jgi:hypothetical protein
MKHLTLATVLLLAATGAQAQGLTVTGSNGGSVTSSRDCTRAEGTANCSVSSTATGANGATATKERLRTTSAGTSTTTVNRTGPNGQTGTRTRTLVVTR